MTGLPVGFPSGPLVDPASGELTPAWRAFFLAVFLRTGGAAGIITTDTSSLSAAITAETAARQTADAGLTSSIAQERGRAETAEQALGERISLETIQRNSAIGAAVTTYLSIAGLRAAWMALDLSVLPHVDPGSGKPWLDGDVITVGSGADTPIELESGAGRWLTEAGTGAWEFG